MTTQPSIQSIVAAHQQDFFKPFLHLHQTETGTGIASSIDLEKDIVILTYPLIRAPSSSSEAVVAVSSDAPDFDDTCRTDQQTVLSAEWLLSELAKRERSEYRMWINLLPKVEDFNLFHSKISKLLDRPEDIEAFEERADVVQSLFDDRHHLLPPDTTLQMYQWSMSMIISRSFDDDGVRYLLPGVDFFNHCDDDATEDDARRLSVDIYQHVLIVSTVRQHKAGVDLCINYSKERHLSTKSAIMQYGFVPFVEKDNRGRSN